MVVRRFLVWSRMVPASVRAEGVRALARAYLYSPRLAPERAEAEAVLLAMLDDPAPMIRRALAEVFASALEAPRSLILALASGPADSARIVLAHSPVLKDADLIHAVQRGDEAARLAVAGRPGLSAAVGAVLAELAGADALAALAANAFADLPDHTIRRIVARGGADARVREGLLSRPDLSASARADLLTATAGALASFVSACGWLSGDRVSRVAREATERGLVDVAAETGQGGSVGEELAELVSHLRLSGRLTPALMLRALFSGDRSLFVAALVELSALPPGRVAGLVSDHAGPAFSALLTRARIPGALHPVFRAALRAQDDCPETLDGGRLSPTLVRRALASLPVDNLGLDRIEALLHRFQAEAVQESAREVARRLLPETPAAEPARVVEIDLAAIEAELAAAA